MGVAIGPRTLLDNALPTGVDATVLFERGLENGLTTQEIIEAASVVIGETNMALEAQYAGLMYFTERDYSRYRQGDSGRRPTPKAVEFSEPEGKRAAKTGHMLPRNDFYDRTEYTEEYLRRGNREDMRDDLMLVAESWRDRVDLDVLTRALTTTEELIGTSGYSPGWAVGTGVSVPYIPPKNGSIDFDSTHTQYLRVNGAISAANVETALKNAARLLSRLRHVGRKAVLVSEADLAYYTGITSGNFVRFVPQAFNTQAGSTQIVIAQGELEGIPGELFGYYLSDYGVLELRYHERIPTTYGFMTKSYGTNDPRNGLAARIEPNVGFGLMVDPEFRQGGSGLRIGKVEYRATHGIGVNDRTNGIAFQVASGGATYSSPTIS